MVKVPKPEEEDRRRLCRERKTLTAERVSHINRIKGFFLPRDNRIRAAAPRPARLEEPQTRRRPPLPEHLKAQVCRELDRLELLLEQIKAVEAERDVLPGRGTRRHASTGGDVARY